MRMLEKISRRTFSPPLPAEFFNRSSVVVAKDLLGKYLVRRIEGKKVVFKIVETEAYEGLNDKASHASRGQTPRNTPMFGEPGTIYIYFTYGMHYMLNIVCGKKGHPSAVLVRGIEGCVGPGRLTKKLQIDKGLNNKLLGKKIGLWIENESAAGNKQYKAKAMIVKTPRIGVDYAGPVWSKKLYRFVLKD
jgi:DNA-3-methyladenine glycosylase